MRTPLGAAPQKMCGGNEPGRLDALGEERQAVDRLDLGVQQRHSGRDREGIAGEEAHEDQHRAGECDTIVRSHGERHGEGGKENGGNGESRAGAGSLREVFSDQRAVDPGADRAAEDDDVSTPARHLTITSPCMSWLCSVQM
jgi:hypothetical protein